MIHRIRVPQCIAGLILGVATILAAQQSFAQPVFTNPRCANVNVTNASGCTPIVQFVTNPAGAWPAFSIAPGGVQLLPVPLGGSVTVLGVVDVTGATVGFNPPPAPFAVCANGWWQTGIALQDASGLFVCSVNMCLDPATCSITIW